VVLALDLEITHRHQDGNARAHQEQIEEIDGEAIDHQRAHESGEGGDFDAMLFSGVIGEMELAHRSRRKRDANQSGDGVYPLPLLRQQQVDHQDAQREHCQHQHRQGEQVVGA
jgi:hypothetical protein